jgi:hypothetical protein
MPFALGMCSVTVSPRANRAMMYPSPPNTMNTAAQSRAVETFRFWMFP